MRSSNLSWVRRSWGLSDQRRQQRLQQQAEGTRRLFRTSAADLDAKRKELRNASAEPLPVAEFPNKAKVVICGGGAQGLAIAYKLALRGWGGDTIVIDKGELGKGTTIHSSGLIPILKNSPTETLLSKVSKDLYLELEKKGFYTGWKECGSLYLGRTDERMHYFHRMKSNCVGQDIACEVVKPDRIKELCSIVNTDDLKGGLWVPGDGLANPLEICLALAHLAIQLGVRIVPNCEVKQIHSEDGTVHGVTTNFGFANCETFVNTAGFWARHIGTLSYPRVHLPLHPAEHYILHTKPIPDLQPNQPVIRDPDSHIYFKENEGRILAGGFEKKSKPAYIDGIIPRDVKTGSIALDWDHFHPSLEALLHRVPSLKNALLESLTNDPEPYSLDGEWILGEAPAMRKYYVAAAMRSSGIGAAGGIGELIADYITTGKTSFAMYNLDIQRFLPVHNNRKLLRDRVVEVPGRLYGIPYPFLEFQTGRAVRTSPIFTKLRDAGARFNQIMCYERPMYFKKHSDTMPSGGLESLVGDSALSSLTIAKSNTFFKPPWFNYVQEEFVASREACSLCDYSSFAKMDIWSGGLEVVDFLQLLCSNNIDVPIGTIVHSGMQNADGGYENDCTLARLAPNRYMLMSPSNQQMRSQTWIRSHLPKDKSVFLQDVTSMYTSLCLMGPNAKAVLATLTDYDLDLPNFTIHRMDIGCAPDILAMTLTHTGELGYVFYIPNEFAYHVFDSMVEAGKDFGLKHCGYLAMRALRIEKFYAFWGQDLDSHSTPLECGRAFRTKLTTSNIDFIGRKALEKQMKHGIYKMLVMMLFDNGEHDFESDPWPCGGEPIYRNDKFVGSVTTSSYGFSLKKHVAIGFVHNFGEDGRTKLPLNSDYVKEGTYEVEIAGVRYPVAVKLTSPAIPSKVSGGYEFTTRHDFK